MKGDDMPIKADEGEQAILTDEVEPAAKAVPAPFEPTRTFKLDGADYPVKRLGKIGRAHV